MPKGANSRRRKSQRNAKETIEVQPAGWPVKIWCRAAGIGRTMYYGLEDPPASVRIGRKRLIRESPSDYLRRIAEQHAGAA